MGASSVQFRVGAPASEGPQSSQSSGRRHKPAMPRAALGTATIPPPCSSLRISFVKKPRRSIPGWRLHFLCSRSPTAETRCRERRQCRRESCREHPPSLCELRRAGQFMELKPQQTGTGLLIRYGKVATTSGSTISLRDGVTSNSALFESAFVGANPAPAANFRPVVK